MTELSEIIAKVKELLPNVTPGPWKRFVPDRGYCIDYVVTEAPLAKSEERHSDIVAETTNSTGPRSASFFERDAEWIALLDPVTVSDLLSRIEELEADVTRYQGLLDAAIDDYNNARNATLEEAALAADAGGDLTEQDPHPGSAEARARAIAHRIRTLKSTYFASRHNDETGECETIEIEPAMVVALREKVSAARPRADKLRGHADD